MDLGSKASPHARIYTHAPPHTHTHKHSRTHAPSPAPPQVLVVRDPRVSFTDNDGFQDLQQAYHQQPEAVKLAEARPGLHYQVWGLGGSRFTVFIVKGFRGGGFRVLGEGVRGVRHGEGLHYQAEGRGAYTSRLRGGGGIASVK